MPRFGRAGGSFRHSAAAIASAILFCVCVFCSSIGATIYSDVFDEVKSWLDDKQSQLQSTAFVSYDPYGRSYLSNLYVYDDFIRVLESMAVSGESIDAPLRPSGVLISAVYIFLLIS